MKKSLEAVVNSIVNEDVDVAKSAFHAYLQSKTKTILAEMKGCENEEESDDGDDDEDDKPVKKSKKDEDKKESKSKKDDGDDDEDDKPAFLKGKKDKKEDKEKKDDVKESASLNLFNKEVKRAKGATAGAGTADTSMKPGIKNSKTKPAVGKQPLGGKEWNGYHNVKGS